MRRCAAPNLRSLPPSKGRREGATLTKPHPTYSTPFPWKGDARRAGVGPTERSNAPFAITVTAYRHSKRSRGILFVCDQTTYVNTAGNGKLLSSIKIRPFGATFSERKATIRAKRYSKLRGASDFYAPHHNPEPNNLNPPTLLSFPFLIHSPYYAFFEVK